MSDIHDAIATLQARYVSAVAARNVSGLLDLYDPHVRVFDAWGVWEYDGIESWRVAVEGWLATDPGHRFDVRFTDTKVLGDAASGVMTAIANYTSLAPDGREVHAMQNRITWFVRHVADEWHIVHEHTSAPIGFEDMKAILNKPAATD